VAPKKSAAARLPAQLAHLACCSSMRAERAACAGCARPRSHAAVRRPRSGDMNEATRRLLGVLLRQMDGFASANNRSVVIGATNRRQARLRPPARGPLTRRPPCHRSEARRAHSRLGAWVLYQLYIPVYAWA